MSSRHGDHGVILSLFERVHWCELTTSELVRGLRQALDDGNPLRATGL